MDGGRLSRLDEFFPAKKRRYSSPNALSSTRVDKLVPSPSKKNTLDSYLVPPENGRSPSKMFEALDAYCSGKWEDLENKDRSLCKRLLSKDHEQPASFLLRRCSLNSTVGECNENLQLAVNEVQGDKSKDDMAAAAEMGKHKNELAQFANDFLSICCSGIVSTETSPSKLATQAQIKMMKVEVENEIDKLKDNMISTLVTGTEQLDTATKPKQSEAAFDSKSEYNVPKVPADLRDKPFCQNTANIPPTACNETAVSKPPEALNKSTGSELTFESPAASNRRGRASLSGVKRRRFSTPQTKSATRLKRTPEWSAGTSLFSRVMNFGTRQFAWWMDSSLTRPSSKLPDEAKGDMLQREMVCGDKRVHKESLLNAELGGTPFPNPTDPFVAHNTHGRVCYNLEGGFQSLNSEISPLPVRRFDFSNSPDKVDDVKKLPAAKNPACLSVDSVGVVALASSKPLRAESPQNETGWTVTDQLQKKIEKTATEGLCDNLQEHSQLQESNSDKVETDSVINQMVGTMDKAEPAIQDTSPTVSLPFSVMTECKSNLSDWLPGPISSVYAKKGLKKLYPWQVDCLQLKGVLEGKNLIYCASTSAGKSLVAEILMLRKVVSTGKKALLVLPYVSICSEKV
ncbi:hypothetical protein L7F22_055295 [Adiantum nelumboides]|nr:hypothetical protein [Adiantum nelumboides]